MFERCRICNRRKRAHLMYDTRVCIECHDSWLKRMEVRGL